jgi:uncharacterized protein (TIGR02569 family)
MHPPPEVLNAFDLSPGAPISIEAGQRDTFRLANVALKRCHDPEQTEWLSAILENLPQISFRTTRPLRANTGTFVVDDWSAANWIEGDLNLADRWHSAITALDAFHFALAHVPDHPVLHRIHNPFGKADALVWSNETPETSLGPTADQLFKCRRPITLASQLIQGDPSAGNFLFTLNLPPAIIDIAPYWRPANYSIALFIADGIAWSGAPVNLIDHVKYRPEMDQLFIRAILFRLQITHTFRPNPNTTEEYAAAYAPVIQAIKNW